MQIEPRQWDELRNCTIYKNLKPKYQKIMDWCFEQYTDLTNNEDYIETTVFFIDTNKDGSISLTDSGRQKINRRQLQNLDALNFEFGIDFMTNKFMPFFSASDIALFSNPRPVNEIDDGDICLVRLKGLDSLYLATKEEVGFFELSCEYLGEHDSVAVIGILENVETL